MVDALTVRQLDESELDRIEADEPPEQGYIRAMWDQQCAGDCVLLIAWLADRPVGSGQLVWTTPPELRNLNVVAALRGEGVGSAIVAAAERIVPIGSRLAVGVGLDNPRARALYERLGYVGTGRVTTTTYEYVADDGSPSTATEVDEELIKLIE